MREAALSRVEVTQAVLREFGIDSAGAIMDPDPALALDDAIRAFEPREVLLSCLYDTRFGLTRKDLVEWAKQRFEVPITHIPVRIEDDAVRWDVTHTLVVATRTVASGDLVARLKSKAAEHPHRYTIISPPSGGITREEVCERLARTLAELYRVRHRRDRPADEPGAAGRGRERARALPDRRDPDLHPRGRAVEVARGGADRQASRRRDRQARRARRGRRGRRRAVVGRAPAAEPEPVAAGEGAPDGIGVDRRHAPSTSTTGRPRPTQSSRIDRQTLGILLFIVSEVMLFGAFFAAYFFIRVVANVGPWPPDGLTLPVAVAGVNTAILVSSSFTIHWALESIRREQPPRDDHMGLGATFMLGAHLPLHPDQRVRPHRLQRPQTTPSARSSTGSRASTAPT